MQTSLGRELTDKELFLVGLLYVNNYELEEPAHASWSVRRVRKYSEAHGDILECFGAMIHPWDYDCRKYRQEKLLCHGIDDEAIRELTFRLGEVIQKVRSCIDHFDLHVCDGIVFTDVCQFITHHLKIPETNA